MTNEKAIIEVIVGTYEEILIGYHVFKEENDYKMEQSFTNHTHCGSIRAIDSTDRHLATGSTDETIKLFNIKNRTEVGSLIQQEGSITCLQFHENRFLFSGSEDGTICIWKSGLWQCLKTLRGHKNSITSISVHPSGKLALSLSKDRTLKTWNLIKGRAAFTTNIKAVGEFVQWSPDGTLYAVVINNRINIYSVETAGIVHTIDFGRRISCLLFLSNEVLAIGGEGENIEFHAARKKGILCVFPTGNVRTKALSIIASPEDRNQTWLITSSSDGFIKIWNFDLKSLEKPPKLVTCENTGCRITCQTVHSTSKSSEAREEEGEDDLLKDDEEKIDSDKGSAQEPPKRTKQSSDGQLIKKLRKK